MVKKKLKSKIKSYSKGAQKLLMISKKIFDNYNVEYISDALLYLIII